MNDLLQPPIENHQAALRILVADDEESMRHFVGRGLTRLGHAVTTVADGHAAADAWRDENFDLAILDLRMPGDGLSTLARLRALRPDAVVLLMTAHGSVDSAVEAMRQGAADFLSKPFEIRELQLRLDRAVAAHSLGRAHRRLRALLDRPDGGIGLCAHSPAMQAVLQKIELLADSGATVLLTGESGTGKGMVAKALHLRSARAEQPFLAMNCAALPDALVESQLFGHEAGAFTGARTKKAGLLQRAHGGTVLLDEIADMSLAAQAKIERFLVEREFTPLGAHESVAVDVRVLAASNRDLRALVEQGAFRQELLWRLDVVPLHVPPLRERRDDIPALIAQAIEKVCHGRELRPALSPDALAAMVAYHWPGNVRELENFIERMVVLAGSRLELGIGDLPVELRPADAARDAASADDSYAAARERFDRLYFQFVLQRADGNVSEAARLAGISRGYLHRRLRALHGPDAPGAGEPPGFA